MNITADIALSSLLSYFNHEKNFSLFTIEKSNENELTSSITTTTATNILVRLFNTTRSFPLLRTTITTKISSSSSSLLNEYFLFKLSFNRIMRLVELFIISLTLPCYVIVLILFIELMVPRISSNTAISGGNSRSHKQRRRQRIRSLIWTLNYLLIDFLSLLYELIYIIIHLTGNLAINSFAGRFYCQLQIYLPLYLTVLMAYSLTAISIYRRRHFIDLYTQTTQSTKRSILLIIPLWIMPIITSIIPLYFLTYLNILRITRHEATNECEISYAYGSIIAAIYMCYKLGMKRTNSFQSMDN